MTPRRSIGRGRRPLTTSDAWAFTALIALAALVCLLGTLADTVASH